MNQYGKDAVPRNLKHEGRKKIGPRSQGQQEREFHQIERGVMYNLVVVGSRQQNPL